MTKTIDRAGRETLARLFLEAQAQIARYQAPWKPMAQIQHGASSCPVNANAEIAPVIAVR